MCPATWSLSGAALAGSRYLGCAAKRQHLRCSHSKVHILRLWTRYFLSMAEDLLLLSGRLWLQEWWLMALLLLLLTQLTERG